MLAYILPFLLVITVLVFVHEYGHFWVARRNGVDVTVFSIGFGPELFGWTDRHRTRWRVSLIPLGGYVKMLGDEDPSSTTVNVEKYTQKEKQRMLHFKTPWQKISVAVAGPAANYIFAIFFLTLLGAIQGVPKLSNKIGVVVEGSIANRAGLQPGDAIEAVNGKKMESFRDLLQAIKTRESNELTLKIKRYDRVFLETVPLPSGEILGIQPEEGYTYSPQSFITSFLSSVSFSWTFSIETLKGLYQMITRQTKEEKIGGILSIADMSKKSLSAGWSYFLWFMCVLSLNLGLINLLPIPVLDGGHILMALVESVRKKPLSAKVQNFIFSVGLSVVLCIMLYSMWNDITHYKVFDVVKGWFIK